MYRVGGSSEIWKKKAYVYIYTLYYILAILRPLPSPELNPKHHLVGTMRAGEQASILILRCTNPGTYFYGWKSGHKRESNPKGPYWIHIDIFSWRSALGVLWFWGILVCRFTGSGGIPFFKGENVEFPHDILSCPLVLRGNAEIRDEIWY